VEFYVIHGSKNLGKLTEEEEEEEASSDEDSQ